MSRPVRMATCHPERKHYCKGLCKSCYQTEREKNNPHYKEKKRLRRAAAYAKNPDKDRNYSLKRRFGISEAEYQVMNERQAGACAICMCPCSTGRWLAVDHDHKTGSVRDLLCSRCNTTLGKYEDSPVLFRRAADYLEKHKAKEISRSTP